MPLLNIETERPYDRHLRSKGKETDNNCVQATSPIPTLRTSPTTQVPNFLFRSCLGQPVTQIVSWAVRLLATLATVAIMATVVTPVTTTTMAIMAMMATIVHVATVAPTNTLFSMGVEMVTKPAIPTTMQSLPGKAVLPTGTCSLTMVLCLVSPINAAELAVLGLPNHSTSGVPIMALCSTQGPTTSRTWL